MTVTLDSRVAVTFEKGVSLDRVSSGQGIRYDGPNFMGAMSAKVPIEEKKKGTQPNLDKKEI